MAVVQTIEERIRQLRYNVLVHSCIYYRYNDSIISDYEYDKRAKELKMLVNKYPDIASKAVFSDIFKEWDISECLSGYDLRLTLPNIMTIAGHLLVSRDKEKYGVINPEKYGFESVKTNS